VVLAAWDRLVGSAPFSHPDGITQLACLTSGLMGEAPRFANLSPGVSDALVGILTHDRSVVLTTGCAVDLTDASRDAPPMLDAQGRAAIDVQLIRLAFETPSRAEVGLHVGAGARWGTGTNCAVERQDNATWTVETCRRVVDR
jgi:hypothetical protein